MPPSVAAPTLFATWAGLARAVAVGALASASLSAWSQDLRIGGTGSALGAMQGLAQLYARQTVAAPVTVLPSMGSGGGIKAVLSGAIQIGLSSRPLSKAELRAGAVAVEYARTPLVLATGLGSKASGLTATTLSEAYAGTTTQWPDGSRIRLVLRPIGEADSELIKSISPALREALSAAEQRKGLAFAITDQDTASQIEKVPGALGVSTLAQILTERRAIRPLAWHGVMPSAKTLADGSYPLSKTLWLVTGPTPTTAARDFITFVGSKVGRDYLVQTGHWVK